MTDSPDWTGSHTTFGGQLRLADIPEPHVRFYPHPEGHKRLVLVGLMRYNGIGVHYYAHVEEEHNRIWHEGSWWEAVDDKPGRGRQFYSSPFKSVYHARKWVREALARDFPPETYEYRWQDYTCPEDDDPGRPRWFYREGD